MKKLNKTHSELCQNIRQSSLLKQGLVLALLVTLSFSVNAGEKKSNTELLKALSPYSTIVTRAPSNFVPSDEIEAIPFAEQKLWVEKTFVADNEGVLNGIRDQQRSWKDTEEYAKNWNVKSTGLYNTPDEKARKSAFQSGMLKYADKRLMGEVKNAEEGSTLAAVGKAQQALRPQGEMGVSKNVKFKFKARALQGEAKVLVDNPWFDYETKYRIFQNKITTAAGKNFKEVGLKAGAEYQVSDKNWVANLDKTLTETLSARISSSQEAKEMAFSGSADKIIQLIYSRGW